MTKGINFYNNIPPVQPEKVKNEKAQNIKQNNHFNDILQKKIADKEIKFSGHCQKRLQQNNIEITKSQMDKLQQAVNKAQSKGSKDSLVLMDNMAFVVSVKNNTVVTAVEGERMSENVFTNIDSAVIM